MKPTLLLAPLMMFAVTAAPVAVDRPPLASTVGAPDPAGALPAEGFVLVAEERGVKVYRRDQQAGIELAAEGTLAASPERVRRLLLDYPSHRRWQAQLKESRVLARRRGALFVYQRLGFYLLDDRDYTLRVTWGSDGDVRWMRFAATSDLGPPPVTGVVRVMNHEGSWRLEPTDGGRSTHAVYRFHLDLGGSLPAWMRKGLAVKDLPGLFARVASQLPRYK